MEFYNNNIQIHKDVINDVFSEIKPNTKMLVFGLGFDSKMWYNGTNQNTFFVEDNEAYIRLNTNDIPETNIVHYRYNITCASSFRLSDTTIHTYTIPEKIAKQAPFDIIIIDGPTGYSLNRPGRLIPCYWSTILSKPGTIIYVDDTNRPLEDFCIKKYFYNNTKQQFLSRQKCTKIFV